MPEPEPLRFDMTLPNGQPLRWDTPGARWDGTVAEVMAAIEPPTTTTAMPQNLISATLEGGCPGAQVATAMPQNLISATRENIAPALSEPTAIPQNLISATLAPADLTTVLANL